MGNTLEKRRHIYELDYIRAVSALFILLFHYTTQYNDSIGHVKAWPVNVPWGSRAVNTFFLLTGYLTVCHYKDSGKQFIAKRFIRLWPAFAVCVVITSLTMAVLMPERLRSVTEIIRNFTMFPGYLGARYVDGVYWTLPVEILFYFWIMIMMIGKKAGRVLLGLYGWVVMAIGAAVCERNGIMTRAVNLIQMGFVIKHASCFALGAAIHLMNTGNKTRKVQAGVLMLLCLVGTWLWQGVSVAVWTGMWALLIWLVTAGKLRFALKEGNPIHEALLFLSKISYTLYLLHQFIGFAILRKLEQAGAHSELWILVPITISILLASLVHYWVEAPTGNALMRLLNNKKKVSGS